MMNMEMLDWIVIGLFAIVMASLVIWTVRQKNATSGDYFLAGKDVTWIAVGTSLFAANIGSEHLIGLAGAGAESGMAMAHWEMQGWMILILGWVFVPFYARSMVLTMPEFLERRYNKQSRSILSVISLVSYVLTKVAVTVYAGGIVFQTVFGIDQIWGIDFFWISAIGLVLITALYTVAGGMKSVLYTAILQAPIMLLGSIVILVLGLRAVGGWDQMMYYASLNHINEYGDTMVNLMRSNRDPNFPWLGTILGSAIIGFWYWCTDQYIVQRVLSGKDQTQARRGAILGAYLKLTPVFFFLIPGMIAYVMYTQGVVINGERFVLASSDAAFPELVRQLLPAGLKGLVVCGILAALMSSLAALFNSSAMLFTVDFYKKYRPQATETRLLYVGRVATVVVVVLGILWIPVMKNVGNVLYEYLQEVQSVLAPGIAAAFLVGVMTKKATPLGGMWGLISGFVIGMIRLGANVYYSTIGQYAADSWFKAVFYDFNWLFFCSIMFAFCALVILVVSRFTPAACEKSIQGLTFGSATPEQKAETRASWNHWDIIHSAIILIIVVAFYIYFW